MRLATISLLLSEYVPIRYKTCVHRICTGAHNKWKTDGSILTPEEATVTLNAKAFQSWTEGEIIFMDSVTKCVIVRENCSNEYSG